MAPQIPRRGEIYFANLDPVVGHEQAGRRPFLVLSIEGLNRTAWEIAVGLPVTTTDWTNPVHVRIEPAESGLPRVSYAMPEMVRSISTLRFQRHLGRVSADTVKLAAHRTGALLGLGQTRF